METDYENAGDIDDYIKENPNCKQKYAERVKIQDKKVELDVFRLPRLFESLLCFFFFSILFERRQTKETKAVIESYRNPIAVRFGFDLFSIKTQN